MSIKNISIIILIGFLGFAFGYQIGIETSQSSIGNANINSEIRRLNLVIDGLESEIADYQQEISNLRREVDDSQLQVLENDEYVDLIKEIRVKQHFEWEYGYSDWTWDLTIPLVLYLDYRSLHRPNDFDDYVKLALDSGDDQYIESLVERLENAAENKGFSKYETVEFVISFVQSLPYTEDDVETPWDEYPRYPIETIFDRGGDCEDTSLLVAALLDEMNYDVCLLILENDEHCAVGIAGGEGIYGTYYLVDETKYYFLETTGTGWEIGELPSSITDGSAQIYPLKDNR
jgi:hypothetical protein